MNTPAIDKSLATYLRTTRDCDMVTWPGWVRKIHYALETATEPQGLEEWAVEVYKLLKGAHKISLADSN